jgi:outer membrane protein assembly factor BamD (BamD/ComL family)
MIKNSGLFVLLFACILVSCKPPKVRLTDEIKAGEQMLFSDSTMSLNVVEANKVFLNYLKYSDTYPGDTLSADFLFRAGDLSNGLNRPKEAIALFNRLRTQYPDYRKAPAALFMEAFIYETRLQDPENAKDKYKEFIEKYPSHKLVPSAQASLDQLNSNLSNEDLIRKFEEEAGK